MSVYIAYCAYLLRLFYPTGEKFCVSICCMYVDVFVKFVSTSQQPPSTSISYTILVVHFFMLFFCIEVFWDLQEVSFHFCAKNAFSFMSFLSRYCGNFGIETSVKAARHAHIHCICGSIPNQMIYYLLFSAKFSLKHVHCACLLLPTIFHCNALHGEFPNTCTYIYTNDTKL